MINLRSIYQVGFFLGLFVAAFFGWKIRDLKAERDFLEVKNLAIEKEKQLQGVIYEQEKNYESLNSKAAADASSLNDKLLKLQAKLKQRGQDSTASESSTYASSERQLLERALSFGGRVAIVCDQDQLRLEAWQKYYKEVVEPFTSKP